MRAAGKPASTGRQSAEAATPAGIPNRSLFKASEVCQIAGLQAYVLRSWEAEFADLGVVRGEGGARVYRRSDVERVIEIKRLLYEEGLTLAGVRRRLDEERPSADGSSIDELFGRHARERLTEVRRGLRSLLDLLSRDAVGGNGQSSSGGATTHDARAPRTARRPVRGARAKRR